ncbi:MAG TPA: carbohydrate ABC transporter permease [Clostridiales bacterium]|nr:carbohydrate ABC transporter permease [Clostridiales bacterium]
MDNKGNRKIKNKIHVGSYTFDAILVVFMIGISIVMIYPFINVIAISLSSSKMISMGAVTWWPKEFNFKGYEIVFGQSDIWVAYKNTIIYAVVGTAINLLLTSMIAYALMINDFALRKPLTIMLLITMFFSGGTVPTYLAVQKFNMINTIWALVLPNAISAYNVFVYRAFYKGISTEIREAAMVDGASNFRILFKIYMPLSKALYATFGLFSAVAIWNSFFDALLYIKDEARQPIQMILRKVLFTSGAAGGTFDGVSEMMRQGIVNPKNVQYACIIATIGPILLVYPFIQKYFAQGVQIGAVKG